MIKESYYYYYYGNKMFVSVVIFSCKNNSRREVGILVVYSLQDHKVPHR